MTGDEIALHGRRPHAVVGEVPPTGHLAQMTRSRRGCVWTSRRMVPPILMYHGVGNVNGRPGLWITPERFEQHMRMLRALGLRGVTMRHLADALDRGEAGGLVGITFDDGYRDVLRFALPILQRYEFHATMFVISGFLNGTNDWDPPPRQQLVSAWDVERLVEQGVEIGSHSVGHLPLTSIPRCQIEDEVRGSRDQLARLLGVEPAGFCYPYGQADGDIVRAVVDAGYEYACAVEPLSVAPLRYALPRIPVMQKDWSARLAAKTLVKWR